MDSREQDKARILAEVLDGCPLTHPCDKLFSLDGWCRDHCKPGQDEPDAECWMKYAELMAISALQAQDVPDIKELDTLYRKAAAAPVQVFVQPEPCEDAVSRKTAIDGVKTLHEVAWKNWHDPTLSANTVIDMIKNLPSAQPEIVRCKDCKHRDPEDKKCDCGHDILWQLPRRDNWYCADAERRSDEC